MLTKTRSDFWKCCYNFRMPTCGTVNLSDESKCYRCGYEWREAKMEPTPATNVEVLIAWLSADDERRKEIEIASRPTKAGDYVQYTLRSLNWTLSDCFWSYDDYLAHKDSPDIDGLWEPIE